MSATVAPSRSHPDRDPTGAALSASVSTTSVKTAAAVATLTTVGVSAACWFFAIQQMNGMDMGVATRLGSFGSFLGLWVLMMVAMMLPSATPAIFRHAHARGRVLAGPFFIVPYVGVWAAFGAVLYGLYRPHGASVAGAVAIAAGIYELTPLKQHFRRRCLESTGNGFGFGLCCTGSSIGLMLIMVAVSVMSVTWMGAIAVVVLAQKLMPERAVIDIPLALAIIGFGVVILLAPSAVPGLTPSM
jgi:predicted metal-binding membrane protein